VSSSDEIDVKDANLPNGTDRELCHDEDQKLSSRKCGKQVEISEGSEKEYACDICGKTLKSQKSLAEHKFLHSADHSTFRCPECGKLLATRATLREHLRWHEGVPRVPCSTCGKLLASEESLRKHVRAVHDKVCKRCVAEPNIRLRVKQRCVADSSGSYQTTQLANIFYELN
jgi:uncharacterized Zn-finger protein